MRRALFALCFLLVPAAAWAQCTGVFPSGYICGNASGSPTIPYPFPSTGVLGTCANNDILANISGSAQVPSCVTINNYLSSVVSPTVPAQGNFWYYDGSNWGLGSISPVAPISAANTANGITISADTATPNQFIAGANNKILTAGHVFTDEVTITPSSTTILDFGTFLHAVVSPITTAITTMTCPHIKAGQAGWIRFYWTSPVAISNWCSQFKWAGGTSPTTTSTAGAIDVLSYACSTTDWCIATYQADAK